MGFYLRGNARTRLKQIQANIRALPQQIHSIAQKAIDQSEPEILDILTFTPPTPKYPPGQFPWESDAQRVAVMIKYKELGITQYQRKGDASRGWRVFGVTTSTGASIIVQNEWDKAKFIYGGFSRIEPQQGFHHTTGWTRARNQRDRIFKILIGSLREIVRKEATQLIFD